MNSENTKNLNNKLFLDNHIYLHSYECVVVPELTEYLIIPLLKIPKFGKLYGGLRGIVA